MDLKLGRLAQIAHAVSDVDAAETFYEQTLGLKKLFRPGPDLVFFDCAGVRLYLQKTDDPAAVEKASTLYLLCDDIAVAARELKRRGITFVDAPHVVSRQPAYDLWMTFFKDPDGHLLALEMQAPTGWEPA